MAESTFGTLEYAAGTLEMLNQGGQTFVADDQVRRVCKAVCRIDCPEGRRGTGFVVSGGFIMTNHHVVPDQDTCRKSKARFSLKNRVVTIDLDPSYFVTNADVSRPGGGCDADAVDDNHLDYTIMACGRDPALEEIFRHPISIFHWGVGTPGDVFVVGHPAGGRKRFSLGGNRVQSIDQFKLRYSTETTGGSSGSPVLAVNENELRVFALHHMGTPKFNQGVCMRAIIRDLIRKRTPLLFDSWIPQSDRATWELFDWYMLLRMKGRPSIDQLKKRASAGNYKAQFALATCYAQGLGVERNAKTAVEWYRRAAAQGQVTAVYHLAVCCDRGEGTQQDKKQAIALYHKAAALGHSAARNELAQIVTQLKQAADEGDDESQGYLGFCCLKGYGLNKDEATAVTWFRKAAARGNILVLRQS